MIWWISLGHLSVLICFVHLHFYYELINEVLILDQMLMIASSFEKKDEMYVETKAYRELKSIVEDQHWATLLGKAGDGKSARAAHLYQRQGYQPIFLSSVRKWDGLISNKPSTKQFVMIDDMFGSICIDN